MQIFVLGMHRSGTSLVGRLINLMGAYFGGEGVALPPNIDNPKGYWERRDVLATNDRLLAQCGAIWYDVLPAVQSFDAGHPCLPDGATAALVSELDAHRPWFIKDPRLCLTLPQWLLHCEVPVAVVCLRDLSAAVASLVRRGPIAGYDYSAEEALALCKAYLVLLATHIRDIPRIVVSYEAIVADPWRQTQQLYDALAMLELGSGLRLPAREEVERFVDATLQRNPTGKLLAALNDELEAVLRSPVPDLTHWLDDECRHHLEVLHARNLAASARQADMEQRRTDHVAQVAALIAQLSVPQARRWFVDVGSRSPHGHWTLQRLRDLAG